MAAGITLAKALQVFDDQLGCGNSRDHLIDKITIALEYLILHGGGNILREWCVPTRNGVFTFPRDLETPVKYRLGETAQSGFGIFNSPYLNYSSQGIQSPIEYISWDPRFSIKANAVCTQYPTPLQGVRVVATTRDMDDVGKSIMVGGKFNGMEVAPTHNSLKTSGELLTIYHEDDPDKKYGAYLFNEITHVIKDPTQSYVMLSGKDNSNEGYHDWYHLAFYHPDEEVPRYTQGQMYGAFTHKDVYVHILGRVNSSIRYVRDEDILPVNTYQTLDLLAKRARYYDTGDFNEVKAIEGDILRMIMKEIPYRQTPGQYLSMGVKSPGSTLTRM